MDYILDILLPKKEMSKINLSELLIEWGGEKYPQNPPRYTNNFKLFFTEYKDKIYYKKFFDDQYPIDKLIALHLEGTLIDLELSINNKGNFLDNEVFLFLTELLKLKTFAILLIRDEEWIDEKYKISREEELQAIIYHCLSWSNPKGVVITNA